jgi:ADP-ribose pyrophosphatase YjhB (NUDIX family)
MNHLWLEYAKRIGSIAQAGLTYAVNDYDRERYQELQDMSVAMLSRLTDEPVEKIGPLFTNETGYQTPKVDVRAVIFRDGKIALVHEKIDGHWSLPGGWADIGYSAGEVAVKEAREEAGLDVQAVRLLAVLDKKFHPHPPSPYHVYKMFILCRITGGTLAAGMETHDAGFFGRDKLPPLSVERNTASQLRLMFDFLDNPGRETVFD